MASIAGKDKLEAPLFSGEAVAPLPDDESATLRVAVLMGQVALGVSLGVPMPELLALAGKTPADMVNPDARVSYQGAIRVIERVQTELGSRPLSLALIEMLPASAFGLTDLASQSAATIGEAVDVHLRFTRLTSSHAHNWLERKGELVALRLRYPASIEKARHPAEIGVGLMVKTMLRRGAEAGELVEAHLSQPPVAHGAAYREAWGCPVFFESFGNALVFHKALLERPTRHADPLLSRSLLARLSSELGETQGEDPLSRFRREVAAHARPAQYNASAVAKGMGVSLRSLQREATKAGTTLSSVIEDLRVARARELLLDDKLSVDEVGFLVDYSERSSFSRAFKRATGQSPADWRRSVGTK